MIQLENGLNAQTFHQKGHQGLQRYFKHITTYLIPIKTHWGNTNSTHNEMSLNT
jgi:hypothetical protein